MLPRNAQVVAEKKKNLFCSKGKKGESNGRQRLSHALSKGRSHSVLKRGEIHIFVVRKKRFAIGDNKKGEGNVVGSRKR